VWNASRAYVREKYSSYILDLGYLFIVNGAVISKFAKMTLLAWCGWWCTGGGGGRYMSSEISCGYNSEERTL